MVPLQAATSYTNPQKGNTDYHILPFRQPLHSSQYDNNLYHPHTVFIKHIVKVLRRGKVEARVIFIPTLHPSSVVSVAGQTQMMPQN
jgi:hypothetical protein